MPRNTLSYDSGSNNLTFSIRLDETRNSSKISWVSLLQNIFLLFSLSIFCHKMRHKLWTTANWKWGPTPIWDRNSKAFPKDARRVRSSRSTRISCVICHTCNIILCFVKFLYLVNSGNVHCCLFLLSQISPPLMTSSRITRGGNSLLVEALSWYSLVNDIRSYNNSIWMSYWSWFVKGKEKRATINSTRRLLVEGYISTENLITWVDVTSGNCAMICISSRIVFYTLSQ